MGYPVVFATLPAGNQLAALFDQNFAFALAKDGSVTPTAGIPFFAGSVALPGIYFGAHTTTGIYEIGLNNIGLSIAGVKLVDFSAGAVAITGATTLSSNLAVTGATTLSSNLAVTGSTTLVSLTVNGQLSNTSGAITSNSPNTITQTWNAGGVTFTGAVINITDTASAAGSLFVDYQVGAVSKFKVDKGGSITSVGTLTLSNQFANTQGTVTVSTPSTLTQTWNAAGVVFTGSVINITDTASAAGSLLVDYQVASVSKFSVNKAGIMVLSAQPNFSAYNSVADANQTGNGTSVTVAFDTEISDKGGNFAANTFTAPVTGQYQFNVAVMLQDLGAAHTDIILELVTSNRTYLWREIVGTQANTTKSIEFSKLVDMDAADTAFVRLTVSGSTLTVDIYGGANLSTMFSGFLAN